GRIGRVKEQRFASRTELDGFDRRRRGDAVTVTGEPVVDLDLRVLERAGRRADQILGTPKDAANLAGNLSRRIVRANPHDADRQSAQTAAGDQSRLRAA